MTIDNFSFKYYNGKVNLIATIRIIVFFIAMCLLFWQTIKFSQIYFAFETTINIKFEKPDRLRYSGITICRSFKANIEIEELPIQYKKETQLFLAQPKGKIK